MKIPAPTYPSLNPSGVVKSIRGYFDYGVFGFHKPHHPGNGKYSDSNIIIKETILIAFSIEEKRH